MPIIYSNVVCLRFLGIQGYQVHIDNNGDAEFNLTLLSSKYNARDEIG